MNNSKVKITLLVLLHLFVFNFFFTYRFTPYESFNTLKEWHAHHHLTSWDSYLKLFQSNITDETYYYEWATLVLGKKFEDNFPFEQRKGSLVSKYFHETPRIRMPYRDISFEYPPLMAAPILVARYFSDSSLGFVRILAGILCAFYMGSLWLCEKIRRKIKTNISTQQLLVFSLFSLFSLGSLFITRLDIIPAFFYLLAIWGLLEGKAIIGTSGIFLGFFSKGFSIILIPLFMIEWIRNKKYKVLLVSALALLTTTLLSMAVLQKMSLGHYFESFRYHAERGIQVESLYALFPWIYHLGHSKIICIYSDHGAWSISISNNFWLIRFSKIFPILVFSFIYLRTLQIWKNLNPTQLLQIAFLLLFSFLVSFKVLSPQFLIWLMPMIFLTPIAQKKFFLGLWFCTLIMTQILYPHCYSFLTEYPEPWAILLLICRNLFLIILWIYTLQCLRREQVIKL